MFLLIQGQLYAHCQVPCGIYNDALRIAQIQEDFKTIEKAMEQINQLSNSTNVQDLNQYIRWVNTKEDHASRIQETVSDYFLIQRIKAKIIKEDKAYNSYVEQTTILHQLMVRAMKCKQTVNQNNVKNGLELLDRFVNKYFDDHGRKHIKEITGSH